MKETYKCPHGINEVLIGLYHECYCNQCNSEIFSDKDKIEITKQEMSLNKDKQQ